MEGKFSEFSVFRESNKSLKYELSSSFNRGLCMLICGHMTLFELYSLFTTIHNNPSDNGIYLLTMKMVVTQERS